MIINEESYLIHYGIIRRSGRYPWGSGQNPYQRSADLLAMIKARKAEGYSDAEIIKHFNLTVDGKAGSPLMKTTQFRDLITIARNEKRAGDIALAVRLRSKGLSNKAIAEKMGLSGESQVRSLLKTSKEERIDILKTTSQMLKDQVGENNYIDIGTGIEKHLGVSPERLRTATMMLQAEGYKIHKVQVEQLGTPGYMTTRKVITPPGTEYLDVKTNLDRIKLPDVVSSDNGRSFYGDAFQPPIQVDSKRIDIRYAEQGGTEADGVVYVRPGVEDLSLGGKQYAQVRIGVDGTHYIKGMAMFKDDLPPGVDLQFNVNKSNTGNKLDALKPLENSADAPFGATIRKQIGVRDETGKLTKVTSAMNIVNEEGHWDLWSKTLASQALSKQSHTLAKTQLGMKYDNSKADFDEIMSLTNPAVKRKLLNSFADSVDASAVHLEAAKIPGSSWHVILPFNKMKDTEIYAPNFRNGDRVALIRYPHGGTFEIPELTVNNRHPAAKNVIGQSKDAVGINHKVAERLSGADFDGDTVMVIPNNTGKIKSTPALEGLKNFDPRSSYPPYDGMKTMGGGIWDAKQNKEVYPPGKKPSGKTKQLEMGKVSNLITDMTLQGANPSELARAVRHSMVVIDAEKHALNYRESAKANQIPQLMEKYQKSKQGGASTLLSLTTSPTRVPERKLSYTIDPKTGVKTYNETGRSYVDKKTGKTVVRTTTVPKGSVTDDAHTLSRGTKMEAVYADHANRMKALANDARREMLRVQSIPQSPSAKKVYAPQVKSLEAKLHTALRNAPLEREAQTLANLMMARKKEANPQMDHATIKKENHRTLKEMRIRVGAGKELIQIEPKEWEAIQAGAISNNMLTKIVANTDIDHLKELSMPKAKPIMSPAMAARARAMAAQGKTQAEIAEALGVSTSTVKDAIS